MVLFQSVRLLLEAISAFLVGTILFDIVHITMHKCLRSKIKVLKAFGQLHTSHHRFFPKDLIIKPEWQTVNFCHHVLFEYIIELIGILCCLLFFSTLAVFLAILFATGLFIHVWWCEGEDNHHQSIHLLSADRGGLFVSAAYHALHHIYPERFYSGHIKIIDYLLGTSLQLSGKVIVMTGANGALGSKMKIRLEKEGALVYAFKYGTDYDYDHYSKLIPMLTKADILFLCHGSKYEAAQKANCDSFVSLIELFKQVAEQKKVPLEIWAVGSEIECHPCFGMKKLKVYASSKRNFARHAWQYYHDDKIQYRHLVHAAFTSKMGPGLMSANFASFVTLFLLKRGFKYIPVTYTGFGYLNYFRFLLKR